MADVFRLEAALRLRLSINAIELAEAIEIVHIRAAHGGRHRLEDVIDRHAERAGFFAIKIDFNLRIIRIERSEDVAEFRTLPRGSEELSSLISQLIDAH